MGALGLLLLVGVTLTLWWGGTRYATWTPARPADSRHAEADLSSDPVGPVADVARRATRGVAIALVGGFWAGALVTGPAVRLIMRLLAATAGDDAQGRLTEADEVVGRIELGGTIGLYVFGGLLPGVLSGVIYLLLRRWLPTGRLGGVTLGALHLVFAATRIDPLRPDNRDFELVGPGWLSVATFGLTCLLHGMAVVAIANRYSHHLPPVTAGRADRLRAFVPLVPPVLLLVPGFPILLVLVAGIAITVALSRVDGVVRAVRSRGTLLAGRLAIGVVALAFLPSTLVDLHDVIVRDEATSARATFPDGHLPSPLWGTRNCAFMVSVPEGTTVRAACRSG